MTGDADEAHQSLIARFNASLERALRAQRGVPLDRVGKAVKLDEIDVRDPHPFKGKMNLAFSALVGALARLGGEEKVRGIFFEPRSNPQFRVAVPGRDIDVVD